jgi:crotonobetainyl-CoA:carnitine CoA-transferase CaiB-like acyl-CoA transferase
MSGFTSLNGPYRGAPMNLGYPLSDAVAGLFGAIGILSAAFHRLRNPDSPGQEIDVAATEAMFRVLDFLAVEHDQLGTVRERLGNLSAYSAPSNIYATRDGKWLSMAVSTQSIFERLCQAIERPDLVADPRYADNQARVAHREVLDKEIADWMAARDLAAIAEILTRHEVTFSPVYSIADVFEDPHFRAREMVVSVPDRTLGPLRMQNVVPRFSRTPGSVQSSGPDLGQDNAEIYGALGLDREQLESLRERGVI